MTQMPLPNFWPDRDGIIKLPSDREWKRHLPRRRSLSTWLLQRVTGLVGFGSVRSKLFAMWLKNALSEAAFECLTVSEVIDNAVTDLRIEREEAIRMFVSNTAQGAEFRSDGQIVTVR